MCSLTVKCVPLLESVFFECRMCSLNVECVPLLTGEGVLQEKRFFKMREPEKMPEHMKRNQVSRVLYTYTYIYKIRIRISIKDARAHEA